MRIETYGQHFEVTPALHAYVEAKFARLGRHFDQPLDVRTQLGVRKPGYAAEATVSLNGRSVHADAGGQNMYAAIDILADKLDRIILKRKQMRAAQRAQRPELAEVD